MSLREMSRGHTVPGRRWGFLVMGWGGWRDPVHWRTDLLAQCIHYVIQGRWVRHTNRVGGYTVSCLRCVCGSDLTWLEL